MPGLLHLLWRRFPVHLGRYSPNWHTFVGFSHLANCHPRGIDVLWQTRYCLTICTFGGPATCPKCLAIPATLPGPLQIRHKICQAGRSNNDFVAS
jgi:hypothetical protein